MTPMVASALSLAARGWPVFPCAPGTKVPLYGSPHPKGSEERRSCRGECGQLGHGVLDATTDPEAIAGMWERTPRANPAVATGSPGPDVVDFDVKNNARGADNLQRLLAAGLLRGAFAVVRTPSGGWHFYFAGSRQGNSARPRHGVDYRGVGGYVVTAPGAVSGKRYELIERREPRGITADWGAIRDFLDPPRPPRQRTGDAGDFTGLIRWLESRPAGDHNSALYWAARRAIDGGARDDVLDQLRDAIVRAGHNPTDAEKTIRSAQHAGAAR